MKLLRYGLRRGKNVIDKHDNPGGNGIARGLIGGFTKGQSQMNLQHEPSKPCKRVLCFFALELVDIKVEHLHCLNERCLVDMYADTLTFSLLRH